MMCKEADGSGLNQACSRSAIGGRASGSAGGRGACGGRTGGGGSGHLSTPAALNIKLMDANSPTELLRLHAENGGSFSNVNLATCAPPTRAPFPQPPALTPSPQPPPRPPPRPLHRCSSRLGRAHDRERSTVLNHDGGGRKLEALREQTMYTLDGWGVRELANLVHALGKLEACGNAWNNLWEAVVLASLRRCVEFNPQDLANTA